MNIRRILRRLLGKKKTVRIVAAGPATRDLCPWDHDAELWSLNRMWRTGWLKREPDRWFDVHATNIHSLEKTGEDNLHIEWLKQPHDFPIYFLHDAEDYPSGVRYPIEHVGPFVDWELGSSIGYMMALAIWEGFDRIELYGVEMPVGGDYFWQRPNIKYLQGLAVGMGIDVYVPPQSSLRPDPLYSYDSRTENYDNRLRQELNTMKRNIRIIDQRYKTMVGVVQGINAITRNIQEFYPEFLNNQDFQTTVDLLLTQYKGEARVYERAINMLEGDRKRLIKELSYRNEDFKEDVPDDVDSGGTDVEDAMKSVEMSYGKEA